MTSKKFEKPEGKEHLDKDFLEELKHKIWSTKGTRFTADNRLKKIDKLSNLCINILSVYLIIFGLLSVYNIYNPNQASENLFAFSLTATSILLLLFSVFENSQNYPVKAKNFHDCALDLADLYNELQTFKTYKKDVGNLEKMQFCEDLQSRYQNILRRYENHKPIDSKMFKSNHMDYYKNLNNWFWFRTNIEYIFKTKFIYIGAIIVPGLILAKIILR
ncbi:hypothetical protein GCM10023115_24940 [Pontixanthobacter gangjinensis]|uniref:SLATT domain-containing protein n=1 Tax=Christiangramia aestuarii TaxID=1028746 RepID=A0A7K1LSX5_9FLAO|nr:SLATT domain-containing protein [Christiangramia aestuarii]MUP43924.1 SLATT domain-containing protein [Christiangramia aestuarii]